MLKVYRVCFVIIFLEKEGYDNEVKRLLKGIYCVDDNNDTKIFVYLDNIDEEIRLEFRKIGETYNFHINHIKLLTKQTFPTSKSEKKGKKYPLKCFK